MWQNPQETADLVTFTEEILNGKLHFLCSVKDELSVTFKLNLRFEDFINSLIHRQISCSKDKSELVQGFSTERLAALMKNTSLKELICKILVRVLKNCTLITKAATFILKLIKYP